MQRRQAYHKQLQIWVQVFDESENGSYFLIKHPFRGEKVWSPQLFYDLSLRGPADLRRRQKQVEKLQQEQQKQIQEQARKIVRRTLPDSTVVKLDYITRVRLDRKDLVLIRHKQAWWLARPKDQRVLASLAAAGDPYSETRKIERTMRRLS